MNSLAQILRKAKQSKGHEYVFGQYVHWLICIS